PPGTAWRPTPTRAVPPPSRTSAPPATPRAPPAATCAATTSASAPAASGPRAPRAGPAPGRSSRRSAAQPRERPGLDLGLGQLGWRRRVDPHPAPDGQREPSVGDQRGANGDGQVQIARRPQPPGGARVRPARVRLELVDDLHGAALGGAGDRTAGEGGA